MQPGKSRLARLGGRWVAVAALTAATACSVSQDKEVQIGKENAAQVESEVPLLNDTTVDRFVATLGSSMASRTSRADLEWHFKVVNSPEVNAFALPGGFVYVNRGVIEQADRLDELAGIMGHEIGHVVRRHGVEQMQKRQRGEVGLVLLCTLTSACRTIGGRVAIDVGANALAAHYSQHDEAQADSEGVLNTVRAGIDPEGLPSFFQKLLDRAEGTSGRCAGVLLDTPDRPIESLGDSEGDRPPRPCTAAWADARHARISRHPGTGPRASRPAATSRPDAEVKSWRRSGSPAPPSLSGPEACRTSCLSRQAPRLTEARDPESVLIQPSGTPARTRPSWRLVHRLVGQPKASPSGYRA